MLIIEDGARCRSVLHHTRSRQAVNLGRFPATLVAGQTFNPDKRTEERSFGGYLAGDRPETVSGQGSSGKSRLTKDSIEQLMNMCRSVTETKE